MKVDGVINILPDNIANQIAAGEVIQRPASVVKELLENAVDAEATQIQLIIKDAGKTLIQVIDNGKGMNDRDARICFERHATSKIKSANDLYSLVTKGFRGEALATIAAIAQVELKTKTPYSEIGTLVINEGCVVKEQTPIPWQQGTSVAVKNLFFNVPARRNFLKNDTIEYSHIVEEFTRVALAHPEIEFILINNNQQVYTLPKGKLKQRIVNLFGSNYNNRIVPIESQTGIVTISGFIGKPEYAKKKKGEQYFFVNKRFIKSNYLNHAVINAYEGLLITEAIPSYFIFMEVDPKIIDVNIHPTKTEIKFEDEKAIYLLLKSAVKMAIGQNNISPSLDFETETSFSNIPPLKPFEVPKPPKIQYNPNYNPFTNEQNKKTETKSTFYQPFNLTKHNNLAGWESLYEIANNSSSSATVHTKDIENEQEEKLFSENAATPDETRNFMQWQNKYIVTGTRSGLYIIDQHLAHKRVLFEYYINKIGNQVLSSQQLLFPFNITLSPAEYALVSNHLKTFEQIGFVLTPFGGTTFNVTGIPFDITDAKAEQLIYQIINELKENNSDLNNKITQLMVACLSNVLAIKAGQPLHNDEIIKLIGDLFACSNPYTTPDGEKIMITLTYEEFIKRLNA